MGESGRRCAGSDGSQPDLEHSPAGHDVHEVILGVDARLFFQVP